MAQQDKTWESTWQSAMDKRSVTPPEEVWENIALELDRPKKRTLKPVWWVAATISIIAIGGILISETRTAEVAEIVVSENSQTPSVSEDGLLANTAEPGMMPAIEEPDARGNESVRNVKDIVAPSLKHEQKINNLPSEKSPSPGNLAETREKPVHDFLPELVEHVKSVALGLKLPEFGEIWGVPVFNNSKRKKAGAEWYAGLNLATGSSSAGETGSSGNDMLIPLQNSYSGTDNSSSGFTSSTSYGITVGKKLTRKIILEGGLTYMRLQNTGTTNIAVASATKREAFNLNVRTSGSQLTSTAPYNVENVHQFISIPVKAGYLILDQKWKMSVNAGVAGDYFIKTHTEDLTGNLEMYETRPSTDPQWNSMTLSVLGEMNLSRELGNHYIIAVTPQVRQSLSDLSNTRTEFRPFIMQVGVQLKYRF